jgi:hypothetical protein
MPPPTMRLRSRGAHRHVGRCGARREHVGAAAAGVRGHAGSRIARGPADSARVVEHTRRRTQRPAGLRRVARLLDAEPSVVHRLLDAPARVQFPRLLAIASHSAAALRHVLRARWCALCARHWPGAPRCARTHPRAGFRACCEAALLVRSARVCCRVALRRTGATAAPQLACCHARSVPLCAAPRAAGASARVDASRCAPRAQAARERRQDSAVLSWCARLPRCAAARRRAKSSRLGKPSQGCEVCRVVTRSGAPRLVRLLYACRASHAWSGAGSCPALVRDRARWAKTLRCRCCANW